MHITSPFLRRCKFKLKFAPFQDSPAGVFLWWHKRGRTCISVSGVFAILILWRARLSGRNVSVRGQTAWQHLSHVFPLAGAIVRGFVSSIIFWICLLSWFKPRLSAYSPPVISRPLLPPPLTLWLDHFFPPPQAGVEVSEDTQIYSAQISGGAEVQSERSRDTHLWPTISVWTQCQWRQDVWRWLKSEWWRGVVGEGVGGRGGHHLDWMRVRKFFPSQGQGANLFISPGSYNEILRSTLLWWWEGSAAINLSLPFGCQWWTIYYDAFKDTAWYLYDSAILCNDIHFIVPYNTNEEIKNKPARRRSRSSFIHGYVAGCVQ